MAHITLTDEQARIAAAADRPVPVHDPKGNLIGHLEAFDLTPADIAELKRRAASPGPFFTGDQVQARLQALQQEWDRTGGENEAHMQELLMKLDEADPGRMRRQGKAAG